MHMCLILFSVDAWDKVSTAFIICFGFWGFQTIASLNSYDWLLLHSVPTSINILHHILTEVCHPLMKTVPSGECLWKGSRSTINIQGWNAALFPKVHGVCTHYKHITDLKDFKRQTGGGIGEQCLSTAVKHAAGDVYAVGPGRSRESETRMQM